MSQNTVKTTVALPAELLEAADQAVREGKAANRDELVATALRHELLALSRATIDADFAEMANDEEYQQEARQIMAEFAQADLEAFRLAEKYYQGDKE
jgi:Arc/MetJ-type ribon-helix-helix transcriptional regulator